MKRLIILTLIACCAFIGTQAIPAYPHRVKIVTKTDSFHLTLRGDENCKFALTDDGFTAMQDSSGWFYVCSNQAGDIIKSAHMVCSASKMKDDTKSFLASVEKGLVPSYNHEFASIKRSPSQNSLRSNSPIVGNMRVLIILMQYSDIKFKKTQTDFNRLFNEPEYHDDGAYGSVYDYYNKVSYGQLQLQSDVLGPYTASRNMAYYGGNSSRSGGDMNPKALFDEAIRFATQDVNLADYDSNNDGYVDNVHIIFAGYGEEAGATANAIWSHEMTFRAERIGGMMIDHYSCSPELRGNIGNGISRIGPPCHEIGHALGAMDYYDTDYQTGGYYEGTGDWDIMASGSWNDDGARPADFNPYVKAYNFGWVDVQTLEQDTVNIVGPSTGRNNIFRINTPISGDFFLLDNRQSVGINSAEPGKGLLIFHVGPQIIQKSATNTINSTFPQQCYVVCASARYTRPRASASSYGSISSAGCPYPGTSHKTAFTKNTTPGSYCVNGHDAEISLTTITQLSNGDISLYYSKDDTGGETPPDEPIDDEVDDNGDIIWSDDFEVPTHFRTQNWQIESLKGNGTWVTKTYTSTPSEKEPPTLSGSRYMAMVSTESGSMMGDASRFSCRMVSNDIHLTTGDYILTGKYGGYATQKISNDTLNVEIYLESTGTWITVKTLRITKRSQWDTFSLPINCSTDDMLKLAFTGCAAEKSILFLDNLRLYLPRTDDISEFMACNNDLTLFYRIDGRYIGRNIRDVTNLSSGVYILRQGKLTRKIIIK